jgi:hypothetical protein
MALKSCAKIRISEDALHRVREEINLSVGERAGRTGTETCVPRMAPKGVGVLCVDPVQGTNDEACARWPDHLASRGGLATLPLDIFLGSRCLPLRSLSRHEVVFCDASNVERWTRLDPRVSLGWE